MVRYVLGAMLVAVALVPDRNGIDIGGAFRPSKALIEASRRAFEEESSEVFPDSRHVALEETTEGIHWRLVVGANKLGQCLIVETKGGQGRTCGGLAFDLVALRVSISGGGHRVHLVIGTAGREDVGVRVRLGSFQTITDPVSIPRSTWGPEIRVYGVAVPRVALDGVVEGLDRSGLVTETFPFSATPSIGAA